jgi:inosine/xanthosine triphosphate pyrophosphatase family protein
MVLYETNGAGALSRPLAGLIIDERAEPTAFGFDSDFLDSGVQKTAANAPQI